MKRVVIRLVTETHFFIQNYCIMKKTLLLLALAASISQQNFAQGWPSNYEGVMLQGFYWDSYNDSRWQKLEAQSNEIAPYFNLIWVPQSGNCNTSSNVMGYLPVYLFNQNSSFGTEAELRSMIKTYKAKGTGIIADVVINHRNNLGVNGAWTDYPAETYKGVTYKMLPSDIVGNDDGGKTAAWARQNGQSLSANNDSGEDWSGCRDIDHSSENVRNNYNAYLKFLLEDLGYTGFRYDMVKGYGANYVGQYNHTTKPQFSVGEYWDNSSSIKLWVLKTRVDKVPQSAAFDFPFRYTVRDAANSGDWSKLQNDNNVPLNSDNRFRQYAVTFVENHDTQMRSESEPLDPIKKDTLAANAYLLAMPGTPCVFYRHWLDHKQAIKAMIEVRRAAGITNTSVSSVVANAPKQYVVAVEGTKGKLLCVLGDEADSYVPDANEFVKVLSGNHFNYFLSRKADALLLDKPSGEYDAAFAVKVTRVSEQAQTLVCTTDGTAPTAQSPRVPADGNISITQNATLQVGVLSADGQVSNVVVRNYTVRPFVEHKATIYVRNENNWPTINFHVWNNKGNNNMNGNWPGKLITETKQVKDQTWYYQTFDITAKDYFVNVVFSTGNGSPQTVDVNEITGDRYFVITTEQRDGKYVVRDETETVTNISRLRGTAKSNVWFNLQGQRVEQPQAGQIYVNGQGEKRCF